VSAWASFVVALVALLQVWAIAIWRRFFRRGTIDIFETGRIEIGFSQFGPTLGLHGTLRAVHVEQFVRDIELEVRRERDGALHTFQWSAFRAEQIGGDQVATSLPAGFLVSQAQPNRYNIFFADLTTQNEVEQLVAPARTAWQTLLAQQAPADDEERDSLFDDFMHDPAHVQAYAQLERLLYWNPGDYTLSFQVNTSRPASRYTRTWRFGLTQDDTTLLELNPIPILSASCGLPVSHFNFAHAEYQPTDDPDP
jgi:hypothetical protein